MVPGEVGSPPVSPPVSEVYTAVERPVSYDQVSRAASRPLLQVHRRNFNLAIVLDRLFSL
ncbi:hypothetical protein DPMN_182950 [Dreissena polymorpha]|uniref:Uncharacterized protein n=1 Tax=Dreissena polymorpha TaxID=45954 RepID=A0A9D4DJ44_DREPO|nr:hypothetical protein DPMN_182950 [Dreissena polymorpha]